MFDGVMKISFKTLSFPLILGGSLSKKKAYYKTRPNSSSMAKQVPSMDNGNSPESKKFPCSIKALEPCHTPNSLFGQSNIVGIISGVSVSSTLVFLQKLAYHGGESIPSIVCSDPAISIEPPNRFPPINEKGGNHFNCSIIVENLKIKRETLEQSGACCIVMPCHISHVWYNEVSKGCSVPFLDVGDCVAKELKEAKLKPLEAGSNVRIGVLAAHAGLVSGLYQDKLQNQVLYFSCQCLFFPLKCKTGSLWLIICACYSLLGNGNSGLRKWD